MGSFEVIKPGLLTTVQDFGRKGLAYFAIPSSGVMDKNAARIGQLILGKGEDWPIIECTSIAPTIQFNGSTRIVITGSDFNWKINGEEVMVNISQKVKKGDILKGDFAKNGLRGYICLDHLLDIEQVYNSYSTYTNAKLGGYQGRIFKKGDDIKWKEVKAESSKVRFVLIHQGPEFDFLTDESKKALTQNIYKVGTDSNRMGIRLQGPVLKSAIYQLENSLPVLPGFIQLPPSGLPIIILQDGQISGGYPRIAYVPEFELSQLNQIPLGESFRFKWI